MTTIAESGLNFGPYLDTHCFHVERSATYARMQDRVQMAEFLLLQPKAGIPTQIWVVEAKSSSPRSDNTTRFAQFVDEVREKLTNGLALGLASRLQRHQAADAELSADFKNLDLAHIEFRLVLVIKGHRKEWLGDLQDALKKALHAVVRTWALGSMAVAVLNEEGARKYGLVR